MGLIARTVEARAGSVPVDPDAEEARRWLLDELSGSDYRAAQPTWFDLLAAAVRDWFESLSFGSIDGPPGIGALVVVLFVVVLLVIAFLVFGLPRLNRRSAVTGSLFGDDDDRASEAMRAAADAAATRGDYSLAVAEMFRAIARSLAERTVVTTTPGTTAHDFAARAARVFPESAAGLTSAAHDFDDVRYLGRAGTAAQFTEIATLERQLRAARPVLEPVGA